MSPALANFVFEAVNFLLLAAALGWVLFTPVRRALDAEQERHASDERESQRLRAEAQSLAEEARTTWEAMAREVDERRKEILLAAQREASNLIEEVRKTQRNEREALERELTAKRDADAAALAETVGRLAAESVRRLLDTLSGPSLDSALVRAACAELEALPAEARESAVVESARALEAEARKALERALGCAFQERIVNELGAGVRVSTPAGQVDATAASVARRAARAVRALDSEVAATGETNSA